MSAECGVRSGNLRFEIRGLSSHVHTWDPEDYAAFSDAQQAWARELIGRLQLRGDERILDVGCGDGRATVELARRVPHGFLTGIDSSPEMIEHARHRFPASRYRNLEFRLMDARAISLPREYDVVFSNAALHWVDDHRAFLAGAGAVLRPGGRLSVSCGGRGNAEDVFRALRALMRDPRWRAHFRGLRRPYFFYGPEDYLPWLAEALLRPEVVQLAEKEMVLAGRAAFAGWVRTTWIPYTQRVPAEQREDFLEALMERYLARHPTDAAGRVRVRMVRLEIEARTVTE